MFRFRKLEISDSEFLREMFYESIYTSKDEKRPLKEIIDSTELAKYYQNWGERGDLGVIVELENIKVGAAWVRIPKKNQNWQGYVNNVTPILIIAINQKYRNLGLGKKLINLVFEELKNKKTVQVSLSVDKRNAAIGFYKALGFTIFSSVENYAYIMTKKL